MDYPGLPEAEFLAQLNGPDFTAYQARRQEVLQASGRRYEVDLGNHNTGWRMEGDRMKLAWVSFNATIPLVNTVEQANEWYRRWEDYRKGHVEGLGGFQTTEVYVFMVTQNEMVYAALSGIFLSLFVAFAVMAITTKNWRLTLLGLFNIAGITVVFLGIMPLIGWSLGESECIFLIAVVGLSVDYTAHLLHSYHHGVHFGDSREDRSKYALSEMGVSVTNSAITTILAALVLFGCGFYFFFQFGAFIFFVIGFSILMSITFLIPLLLLVGPNGETGNFRIMFWRPKEKSGSV
jgi:predicted RND superfamily exporter protein